MRKNRFSFSILMRAMFSNDNLFCFDSRAASIVKSIVSKQMFSIFKYIPNLSRLDNLEES